MPIRTTAQYLGIANSLALVATFAGTFTYSSVITIQTQQTQLNQTTASDGKKDEFSRQSTLLSISFILFTAGLFVTIIIQLILRECDPDGSLDGKSEHTLTRACFIITAVFIVAGFVLLDIALIGFGQTAVAVIGMCTVVAVAIILIVIGFWRKIRGFCETKKKADDRAVAEQEARDKAQAQAQAQADADVDAKAQILARALALAQAQAPVEGRGDFEAHAWRGRESP